MQKTPAETGVFAGEMEAVGGPQNTSLTTEYSAQAPRRTIALSSEWIVHTSPQLFSLENTRNGRNIYCRTPVGLINAIAAHVGIKETLHPALQALLPTKVEEVSKAPIVAAVVEGQP